MFDEIIAPLLSTEWGRRLGWGAMLSLFLLVVIALILSLYAWHEDYLLAHRPPKPISQSVSHSEVGKLIAGIPNQHIFGKYGAVSTLPITSLQLRLVGVIKSEPEAFSRVIISEGGKPGKVYQIGDTLTGGVKINAITPEGVVLMNGDQLEKLPLQRAPLQFQGMPKPLLPNDERQEE
jgi:type II secretory pathway component PulC